MGTTCTRLAKRFAVLLLMITAGRRLRTSPPVAPSKATHQTSPRFIDFGQVGFTPFVRFGLALLVGGHRAVAGGQRIFAHERAGQIFEEPADMAAAKEGVEAAIDVAVNGD